MSGKVTVKGMIGNSEHMRPQQRLVKSKDGSERTWRFFRMFAEDLSKPMVERGDKKFPATSIVLVSLPDGARGEGLFKLLTPGRQVQVSGVHSTSTNTSNGKVYVNESIRNPEVLFLDSHPVMFCKKLTDRWAQKGLISAELATKLCAEVSGLLETVPSKTYSEDRVEADPLADLLNEEPLF